MTRTSVRQTVLLRSVQRHLPAGEKVSTAIMMSNRHRWFLPYAILSGLGLFVVAAATGIDGSLNRIVLALCGAAIAGIATTNYAVLAETTDGLVLLRASRVRQYAKRLDRRLASDVELRMIGSTVVTSDWRVDDMNYTLTKRWEAAMRELATRRS